MIDWNDKEALLGVVRMYGHFLRQASESLRNDKEVVLEAVKGYGPALRYTSESLRDDKEVVLEAVRNHGGSLEYASEALRNNKEVVLEAVNNSGWAIFSASEALKNDKEIVLEAVKNLYGHELLENGFLRIGCTEMPIEKWLKTSYEDFENAFPSEKAYNFFRQKMIETYILKEES